jgi:hypothetical protein
MESSPIKMNPSEKTKQSCAPGIVILLLVVGFCVFINYRHQEVKRIRAEEERNARALKSENERAEKIKAEEHKQKFETPITAEGVPSRVEALMKKHLGERFVSSSANYNETKKGWRITVEVKTAVNDRSMIEQEMVESLSASAPKGMAISSFTMTYMGDFTDGLGHKSVGALVKCSTLPGVIDKIEWGNRGSDLWALKFDRIFSTDYCHPSFAYKWASSD